MKGLLTFIFVVVVVSANAEKVPYFPAVGDSNFHGLVRIFNHSTTKGNVSVKATDDSGLEFPTTTFPISANETVEFISADLELGNEDKELSGVGDGKGDWRLEIKSDLNIEVLAYVRSDDRFLTTTIDVVPRVANRYRIATFNPHNTGDPSSQLRLVNENADAVMLTVVGVDDTGNRAEVSLTIPALRATHVRANELETGEARSSWQPNIHIEGALGEGIGSWQLEIVALAPITVMNLIVSSDGYVSNLSRVPNLLWRGLVVEPEMRCGGAAYDRNDYGLRHRSMEDDIIEKLGAIFGPFTGTCFASAMETEIEHIVALNEAHTSGMCLLDDERKIEFAGDLLNLTLAAPEVNMAKSSLDAFDWMPGQNQCWFTNRVFEVKQKYGLTVDVDEANTLASVLAGCESTQIVKPDCAG